MIILRHTSCPTDLLYKINEISMMSKDVWHFYYNLDTRSLLGTNYWSLMMILNAFPEAFEL